MDNAGNRIAKAFRDMLMERRYNAITVRMIANRAEVTPRTFYSHFRTKDDLLSATLIADLNQAVRSIPCTKRGWDRIYKLLLHMKRNIWLYRIPFQETADASVHFHFHRMLEDFIINAFPRSIDDRKPYALIADAMIVRISVWLSLPVSYPASRFTEELRISMRDVPDIIAAMMP